MAENIFIEHKTVSLLSESERKSILEYLRFAGVYVFPSTENCFVYEERHNFLILDNILFARRYSTTSSLSHMSLEELKLLSRYFHDNHK